MFAGWFFPLIGYKVPSTEHVPGLPPSSETRDSEHPAKSINTNLSVTNEALALLNGHTYKRRESMEKQKATAEKNRPCDFHQKCVRMEPRVSSALYAWFLRKLAKQTVHWQGRYSINRVDVPKPRDHHFLPAATPSYFQMFQTRVPRHIQHSEASREEDGVPRAQAS